MKLAALIAQTERRLRAARLHYGHGTDNPRDEAAYLVLRGLGLPFDAPLDQEADPRSIEKLVKDRIDKRIPVAYLLKEAWLDGVPFYVDRRVIIPRSHIAGLLGKKLHPGRVRRVLDLCTGSGCLAILAAHAFPRAQVQASDVSAAALAVARINVKRHRLQKRVRLVRSDLFDRLRGERYDVIVSNPPYVAAAAMRRLPPEYRYEPGLALAAGRDGLDLVARILEQAPAHLAPGGLLACEVGDGRRAVERRFRQAPLAWPQDEVFVLHG
ncbi:MAG TPA: 50S ribosomal protein L3 N(5)-glutamine methyltransferase [Burkholderiales bacterium]